MPDLLERKCQGYDPDKIVDVLSQDECVFVLQQKGDVVCIDKELKLQCILHKYTDVFNISEISSVQQLILITS